MAKVTKFSEFSKGEITALNRVDISQRNISKVLSRSKTRKPIGRPEKISSQFKRRIVQEVKKKTSSSSKILKSLVDDTCSTRTIGRLLNNEKIKHEKKNYRQSLIMKPKEKPLEYPRQYQTMSAKEWRKFVFSEEKKLNSDNPDDFEKNWHAKDFPEEDYSKHRGERSLVI